MQTHQTHREWLDLNRGQVMASRNMLEAGFTDTALRTLRATGAIELVRPGVVRVPPRREEWPQERYRARIQGFLIDPRRRGEDPPVLAGHSAATMWGLPLVDTGRQPIYVARPGRSGKAARSATRPVGRVPHEHIVMQHAVAMTTVARTVLDVARLSGLAAGLVAADAAVRSALTTREELIQVAAEMAGLTGATVARACARAANPLAESVGESLSRGRMIEMGVPLPELQVEITLRDGRTVRVDFWWGSLRKVGESDGLVKYGANNPAGLPPSDVVVAEKRREEALRAVTAGVLRWIWADLMHPAAFGAMLRDFLRP